MIKELKQELDKITGIADMEIFWQQHRIKDFGERADMLEDYCQAAKIRYDDEEMNCEAIKQRYYNFLCLFLNRDENDKRQYRL